VVGWDWLFIFLRDMLLKYIVSDRDRHRIVVTTLCSLGDLLSIVSPNFKFLGLGTEANSFPESLQVFPAFQFTYVNS
jgi:hypothetical protein